MGGGKKLRCAPKKLAPSQIVGGARASGPLCRRERPEDSASRTGVSPAQSRPEARTPPARLAVPKDRAGIVGRAIQAFRSHSAAKPQPRRSAGLQPALDDPPRQAGCQPALRFGYSSAALWFCEAPFQPPGAGSAEKRRGLAGRSASLAQRQRIRHRREAVGAIEARAVGGGVRVRPLERHGWRISGEDGGPVQEVSRGLDGVV